MTSAVRAALRQAAALLHISWISSLLGSRAARPATDRHGWGVQIYSPELEWYYPLLKPYQHYIPMVANASWVSLEEAIGWAEAHQEEVAQIVENATAFATRYLSAKGRDCYFAQLLHEWHKLQRDKVRLGSNVEYTPEWSCC